MEGNFRRVSVINGQKIVQVIEELKRIRKKLSQNRNEREVRSSMKSEQNLTDEQLKITATLLPDEILLNPLDESIREFEAAVLFADVSGFTEMSDRFREVENGASKLTSVLNIYLGSMVQEIFSHKGDILKYAGDAFLAIFKHDKDTSMQECVRRAIDSALIIQKNCKNFQTEVGVVLNVKITIAAGKNLFSCVGGQHQKFSSYYVIVGDPVWNAKHLQDSINPGEILISRMTWFYVQTSLYQFEFLTDRNCYRVNGFLDNMIDVLQRQHESTLVMEDFDEMEMRSLSSMTTLLKNSYERLALHEMSRRHEEFSIRSTIDISLENESRKYLRRFISPPLMKMIELDEPIESLAEMRQVVIVIANFVVIHQTPDHLIDITKRVYQTFSQIVASYEGIVNKVTLFDKDMMFLTVFGLRGLKHEHEARLGVQCAGEVHETFKKWQKHEGNDEIPVVSLAVTSGICYCGLVGHSLRREFSVISVIVNRAARLMMAYPNIVSCDRETAIESRIFDFNRHFKPLPNVTLKGLKEQVFAYEFMGWKINEENLDEERKFSIVGCKEMLRELKDFIMEMKSGGKMHSKSEFSCVLIQGENQQGKTRMLIEIFILSHEFGFQCIFIQLTLQNHNRKFFVIEKVLMEILQVVGDDDVEENLTRKIMEIFQHSLEHKNSLWLLNSILKTKFSAEIADKREEIESSNENLITEMLRKIMRAKQQKVGIFIDDIDLMDVESIELFDAIFCDDDDEKFFCVFTLGNQRRISEKCWQFLSQKNVKACQLQPLTCDEQKSLALQFFDVVELSTELQTFIYNNSNGNPGWILTTLESFQQINQIEISSEKKFATFKSGTQLEHFTQIFSHSHDVDLMIFDNLSSFEQSVCKCAAVLGDEFHRDMLEYLMMKGTERQLAKAIVKLFHNRILSCGSIVENNYENEKNSSRHHLSSCDCKNVKIPDCCHDLPITAFCSFIKFQRKSFRKIVYELLTENQRIEFHKKSLVFLHLNTRKCDFCGNEKFPFILEQEVDFKFHDGIIKCNQDNSLNHMIDYFDSLSFYSSPSNVKKKSKKILPVILNYAAYDFTGCQCFEILEKMYKEMINHCHGGKSLKQLIDTKIKLATILLHKSQLNDDEIITEANILLSKAFCQLETNNQHLHDGTRLCDLLTAQVLALQGVCASQLTQYCKALELYRESCRVFSLHFPDDSQKWMTRIKVKSIVKNIKSLLKIRNIPNCSKLTFLATHQLSRTLGDMSEALVESRQLELAKLAAFWSLEKALKFGRHFTVISKSFSHVFKIIHHCWQSTKNEYVWLQHAAFHQLSRSVFITNVNMEGLVFVMKIYHHSMICQSYMSELSNAEKFGHFAFNLCFQTQSRKLMKNFVPTLFIILMSLKRFQDAISLLTKFYSVVVGHNNQQNDVCGLVWYYALAMDVLLDLGQTLETFESCQTFYLANYDEIGVNDECRLRIESNFLAYTSRLNKHDRFTWTLKLKTFKWKEQKSSINQIFAALRVMEESNEKDLRDNVKKYFQTMRNVPNFLKVRFRLFSIESNKSNFKTKIHKKKLNDLQLDAIKSRNFLCADYIKNLLH